MSRNILILFLALIFGGLIVGCSGASNITAPLQGIQPAKDGAAPEGTFQRHLWEVGETVIDPVNQTVDVIHFRTANINCNVLGFCQPPGGPDAVSYKINWAQSKPTEGYIDVDITITHPFPQNMYWGHDVRFIILGNGTQQGKYDTTVRYAKPSELRMVNPDGYTRWWNMMEFTTGGTMFQYKDGKYIIGTFIASARVNPFKYFGDSVTKTEYPPDIDLPTRGEFRSGKTNSRNVLLQFPKPGTSPDFRFKYSIDASWSEPINTPVDSSDDFDLQANCREAYEMKVNQTGSTVYWKDASDFGGDLNLNIEIFDWKQGGGTPEAEIKKVVIESPTLFQNYGGFIDITTPATKSPGTNANSVIFSYTVTNCTPNSQDNQEVLITVEDNNTTTYAPPYGSFSYPASPLGAYHLYIAEVGSGGPIDKTITVIQPNGGESWDIGSAKTILWSSTGPISNVKIEYSEDGGSTFPHLIIGSTPNDGNFIWDPIPDTPTTQAIVKISDVAEPTVFDVSNNVFTIKAAAKSITVTIPNGGEKWQVGTSHDITWTSTGAITNVKIEYYKDDDYDGTKVLIIDTTTNDGSHTWDPIPDDPTTTAKVRVADASDGAIFDNSDNFFEITSEPQAGWQKTVDNTVINPQPNQGTNPPDICVTNLGTDNSRGQFMVGNADDLTINMYNDDYSLSVATYDLWLGAMYDLDLSPYNRMDFPQRYIDVIGLSNSCDTTPFPMNPFKDPGHTALITPVNEGGAQAAYGFWLYGDGSPNSDPNNDPDNQPWLHCTDWDSGIVGGPLGDPALDDVNLYWLMTYSELPAQPQPNGNGVMWIGFVDDTSDDPGQPNAVYNMYCDFLWGCAGLSTQGLTPGYVNDTNPDIMRIAVDDDSNLVINTYPVTAIYILDSVGRIHIVLGWDDGGGPPNPWTTYNDQYLGEGGALGINFGGTAKDIVVMPAREAGYETGWNWLCVLVDTGSGWYVKVYKIDFIGPDPGNPTLTVTEAATIAVCPGVPASIDGDNYDFELHVVAKDGANYKVTVWKYTQG